MDLIVYIIVLVTIGLIHMSKTKNVAGETSIVYTGTVQDVQELPVAQNLNLIMEESPYTIILEELGLM